VKRLREEIRALRRDACLRDWPASAPLPLDDRAWHRSLALHPGTVRRRFERLVGCAASTASGRDGGASFVGWTLRLAEPLADDLLASIESRRAALGALAVAGGVRTFSAGAAEADAVGASTRRRAARSAAAALRRAARNARGRAEKPWDEPDDDPRGCFTPLAARAAAAFVSRGAAVPAWIGLMALLEDYVATWDPAGARAVGRWGAIHGRSGFRCTAPLCTGRANLECHHLEHRSHGGDDRPSNLDSICEFHHHRGEHGLLASCWGRAPLDVWWRLGRSDVAEWWHNERRIPEPNWPDNRAARESIEKGMRSPVETLQNAAVLQRPKLGPGANPSRSERGSDEAT
jgi:hypothetical protein